MELERMTRAARLARIEQMIEQYRAVKQRRLLLQAIKLWRRTEARQRVVELDAAAQWVH